MHGFVFALAWTSLASALDPTPLSASVPFPFTASSREPGCLELELDPFALVVGLASAVALLRFGVEVIPLVGGAAAAGLIHHLLLA